MISRHLIVLSIVSAAALLLSACEGPKNTALETLRTTSVTKNAYYRTLSRGYKTYALERQHAKDVSASNHFAEKALLAAKGSATQPETIAAADAKKGESVALMFARERLMKALSDPATAKEPILAAEAVLAFDCWADLNRSGLDAANLQTCQQEYFEHYAALTERISAHAKAELEEKNRIETEALASKKAEEAKNVEPVKIQSTSTIIYFPFDSDTPGVMANELLDEVIRLILSAKDVDVLIHGHADRAGSEAYNLALSERRAAYVRGRLVKSGVNDKRIQHYGFGESDPKVPTDDGAREPYNRRVEIFIE